VPFVASAEITEEGSSVSIAARVSDISTEGCYIDLRAPLPEGASVQIKIMTATHFFEAGATVGYTHPNLGMGLIFQYVSPESRAVLQNWIAAQANQKPE
jgi:hypothetical protein